MAPPAGRSKKSSKTPSILSHEFIIQNHGDIISCLAMTVLVLLMFNFTSPLASLFVTLQHNVTLNESTSTVILYNPGLKDVCTVIFYAMICIVVHAIVQEYVFDKLNRRLHLSKVKHSKFNESGQLVVFYVASTLSGFYVIFKENYIDNISGLWESYPHVNLSVLVKFYYIIQISYWVHCYPELYFQKIKKDELWSRIQYYTIYLLFITVGYSLNLSRLGLILLTLHYSVELLFHGSRMLYFSENHSFANVGFKIWNSLFVIIRLSTITLSVLTLWYGLSKSSINSIDIASGNFNTQLIRVNCLAAVFLLQAWVMWNFITFHLRRMRDRREAATAASKRLLSPISSMKKKKKAVREQVIQEEESKSDDGSGEEPAVSENGHVRQRSAKAR